MARIAFKSKAEMSTSPIDDPVRKKVTIKSTPVCWIADYEKDILVSCNIRYYRRYDANGKPKTGMDFRSAYKVYIHFKSEESVVAEVRFQVKPMVDSVKELYEAQNPGSPVVIRDREARAKKSNK